MSDSSSKTGQLPVGTQLKNPIVEPDSEIKSNISNDSTLTIYSNFNKIFAIEDY